MTKILGSWLDGAIEYTNLKYEILHLQLKLSEVVDRIRRISEDWPIQKTFIEKAYQVLIYADLKQCLASTHQCAEELLTLKDDVMSSRIDTMELLDVGIDDVLESENTPERRNVAVAAHMSEEEEETQTESTDVSQNN